MNTRKSSTESPSVRSSAAKPGGVTAGRHRRTRKDHALEIAEDYAEAVADLSRQQGACRIKDLARRFGVSHVTVIQTISRLRQAGLATMEPYGPILLTPKGLALARRARRRHTVVVQFLIALGVPEPTAEVDAEGMEHHVSPITLRCMRRFTQSVQPQQISGSTGSRRLTQPGT